MTFAISGTTTCIVPVRDLAAAKTLYGALLGVAPVMDEPYYVGYQVGSQHYGLDPNGHRLGLTGPVSYWTVDDIEASVAALLAAGATSVAAVRDVGGGRLTAVLSDADGNHIGVLQNPS